MKSFHELVQLKRVKMLLLCLFLFVFQKNFGSASSSELTFILRREGGHKLSPICVAEGDERYEGIGWTYPLTEDGNIIPAEDSHYLPTLSNNYDCKFSYNEHCSQIWAMRNWDIDTNTSRRYEFISDERWEEFPTYFVSNTTKDYKENKINIPSVFKLGFSVRASNRIEFTVCEGWNPEKYACYHFNVTEKDIQLNKRIAISENDVNESPFFDSYKAFSNIIDEEEWRNFEIGVNNFGKIHLKDMNLNRTMIERKDEYPLKPAYFFFKSETPSVWKIHKNEFFYTKNAQISRLGPSLTLNSEDLCVNLYVKSCSNCTMTFFVILNGTRTYLEQKILKQSSNWYLVRLSKEQITVDHLNIFVQTSYKIEAAPVEGFWAIDNVRVCHKNEVRISELKSKQPLNDNQLETSCQIVEKPHLRPKKLIYDNLQDFGSLSTETDSTSINITWNTPINLDHFITYQANDICVDTPNFNPKRTKSNGFLVTKSSRISLRNLIPYTTYNITLSTVLHLEEKHLSLNTKESSYISLEELPAKVQIEETTEDTAKVSWDKVDCKNVYGHIFYHLELVDKSLGNSSVLGYQTENFKIINNLKPYSSYTLKIGVTRSVQEEPKKKNLRNFITSVDFKTKPGLAPSPKNLEIYASSNSSLSIRYNLPIGNKGEPREVHIKRCNPLTLKKCKSSQQPVASCKVFADKYCFDIVNLVPNQKQSVRVSLKNDGSHTFGEEAIVEGFTEERVPGQPTNVTYKLVDCSTTSSVCNLNITWLHPYEQNGTITAFEILLNSTENEEYEIFNEKYKIINQRYSPQYSYQIKQIPFSKKYNLYIRSINEKFKSELTTLTVVHTAELGDQIDQSPNLLKITENSFEFELKPNDERLSTVLTVIIQDFDEKKKINEKIKNQEAITDNLCNEFGDTWISQTIKMDKNNSRKIFVGKKDPSGKILKPETKYCITFLMENEYQNSTHENVYYETLTTLPHVEEASSTTNIVLIALATILVLFIVCGIVFCYTRRKRNSRKSRNKPFDDPDHAYESLPFEDTVVNNNMYDQLDHK